LTEQVELLQFIRIIGKRKAIIILGTLVCLLSAIAVTSYITPQYEASAQILVSQGQALPNSQSLGDSYQAILMSERLTKTFSQLLGSRILAEKVIETLELPLLPEDLKQKISAKPVRETQLIQLSVIDPNPILAKQLADTFASEFIEMTKQVIPSTALIDVQIVEPAAVPLEPVSPKPPLNSVLALVIGLIASTGFAFLLEALDVTVKETEEVEQIIELPGLARIPRAENPLLLSNESSIIPEVYRSLRTNLQYLNFDQSIKSLVVSSPNMEEGKTTVSSNLAIVHAQAGYSVLLIDCDLRRPRLSEVFNRSSGNGLSNVLVGATEPRHVVQRTDIEGLYIIASGPIPPNPADLLSSERIDKLLVSIGKNFDLIIMDCPPVLGIADTSILAAKTNAVLLVSSYGKTKKNEMVSAKDALGKVGARIIGFVINGTERSGDNGYYYNKPEPGQ
jgi:receptor protein-tyrosine kinase